MQIRKDGGKCAKTHHVASQIDSDTAECFDSGERRSVELRRFSLVLSFRSVLPPLEKPLQLFVKQKFSALHILQLRSPQYHSKQ